MPDSITPKKLDLLIQIKLFYEANKNKKLDEFFRVFDAIPSDLSQYNKDSDLEIWDQVIPRMSKYLNEDNPISKQAASKSETMVAISTIQGHLESYSKLVEEKTQYERELTEQPLNNDKEVVKKQVMLCLNQGKTEQIEKFIENATTEPQLNWISSALNNALKEVNSKNKNFQDIVGAVKKDTRDITQQITENIMDLFVQNNNEKDPLYRIVSSSIKAINRPLENRRVFDEKIDQFQLLITKKRITSEQMTENLLEKRLTGLSNDKLTEILEEVKDDLPQNKILFTLKFVNKNPLNPDLTKGLLDKYQGDLAIFLESFPKKQVENMPFKEMTDSLDKDLFEMVINKFQSKEDQVSLGKLFLENQRTDLLETLLEKSHNSFPELFDYYINIKAKMKEEEKFEKDIEDINNKAEILLKQKNEGALNKNDVARLAKKRDDLLAHRNLLLNANKNLCEVFAQSLKTEEDFIKVYDSAKTLGDKSFKATVLTTIVEKADDKLIAKLNSSEDIVQQRQEELKIQKEVTKIFSKKWYDKILQPVCKLLNISYKQEAYDFSKEIFLLAKKEALKKGKKITDSENKKKFIEECKSIKQNLKDSYKQFKKDNSFPQDELIKHFAKKEPEITEKKPTTISFNDLIEGHKQPKTQPLLSHVERLTTGGVKKGVNNEIDHENKRPESHAEKLNNSSNTTTKGIEH